ncbi:hypothetical protein Indivirus_5_46 [Indivirus ILV1]|uniref:Uncharacterized protein n=1 Tax=Indivirus ILV1 TaxID=1977633 RepID=A0A1V0SDY4_9VIRU|nr:hypothetical protein Indivirus_5_46 [Indivirus ILV1]
MATTSQVFPLFAEIDSKLNDLLLKFYRMTEGHGHPDMIIGSEPLTIAMYDAIQFKKFQTLIGNIMFSKFPSGFSHSANRWIITDITDPATGFVYFCLRRIL